MRRLPGSLRAIAALLSITFFCSAANAQNGDRLLHPGLLGYCGGIENEVILAIPAASGQAFVEAQPYYSAARSELNFRLGNFHFKRDGLDDFYGGVPFVGIGLTNNNSDNFSGRFAMDFVFGDEQGLSLFILPMKFSVLFHPPLAGDSSVRFKPYLGTGFDLNFISETDDWEGQDLDGWGAGIHFLVGVEAVMDEYSLGLEFGYSAVETHFDTWQGSVSFDTGGLSILFNLGIPL